MTAGRLRVTQVAFIADPGRRSPQELLTAWPTLHAVARAVEAAGAYMTVVQPASVTASFAHEGVQYEFVSVEGTGWLRGANARTVADAVAATNPQVVYMQGLNTPRALHTLERRLNGVPIVVQDRAGHAPTSWRRFAHRVVNGRMQAVVFTARSQAAPWHASLALPRSVPVYEAMPMSSPFTPGSSEDARLLTDMHGDPCLLWVARLDANKDPLTVLRALELAVAQLPDARLYCCFTDAPLLGDVQRMIAGTPALQGRVELLGARPQHELEQRYRAADFLIQMSHHEGSGFSVIEALSCGLPPLVSDIPSFRKMVGGAGSLTPVDDALALSRAIVSWSGRDRPALRRQARAQFEQELSFGSVGSQLVGVFHDVIRRAQVAS